MNKVWKRSLVFALLFIAIVLTTLSAAADPYPPTVAVSAKAAGTTEDGVAYDPYDILVRKTYDSGDADVSDETTWYTLFNGEDFGLGTKHAIDAFSIDASGDLGPACALYCVDAIYMSFLQSAVAVPGVSPKVEGQDVVVFEPDLISDVTDGDFSLFFDGSDVGLTTTAEKIDGLDVYSGVGAGEVAFPYDCGEAILFISTQGAYRVPAANGGSLVGEGNDVLMFCATNLGWDTAGFWFRGFDADDQDWPTGARNAISGIDVDTYFPFAPAEQEENEAAFLHFTFTVKKSFNVPDASGGPSEIFGYPEGCADTVYGPIDDLNDTWPALNGVVAGYDMLSNFVTSDC